MLKKNLYTCLLLAAVLLLAKLSFGQQNVLADFNLLPGGVNTPGGSAVTLCPSVSSESVFSISTFSVPLNSEGLSTGNPRFEWVVFGGAIVDANGSVPTNEAYAPQNVGGVTYYYISSDNFSLPSAVSTIQVQWDDADVPAAWVAVRQVSEWGCSAGPWSVYTNIIANIQPTFTSFPPAIRIAYDERVGFELPDPQAFSSDDGCPRPLTYSYSVLLPSSTLLTGDRTNLTLTSDLEVGNNTVTYRIFDGLKFSEQSYIITVDPEPTIDHVAWYNPICPGGNGYVMVSDMQYNNAFPIVYSFDNGSNYSGASDILATAGDLVSIRARVTYSVDMDFNGSIDADEVTVQETPATAVCEVTLHDPETTAVNAVPVQGDVAVTIKNAECASDSNGYIFVEPTSMSPQNSSLTFNGSGSHLLLNKAYNSPLMQFSVAAWIKVPAGAVGNGAIVSFNNSNYYQLTISTPSGGINYVQFETGATPTYFAHSTPINDGKWHLVVATYNGGERTIYIDGKPESVGSVSGTPTGSGDAFGIIGARSTASTFGAAPAGNYFTGQMAAVGIYNSPLSQSEVDNLMLGSFAGAPSLWVFDETPDMVSSQAGIFSDFASLGSIPSEWARAVGLSYSSGNAPVIYNWTPDKAPADYDTELEELKQGAYQFTVKDIFSCTPQNETYTVGNDDQDPPQILVNVALGKDASQISDASGACTYSADRAVDAYIDGNLANCNASATGSATDPWWEVDLGYVARVKQVVVNFANGSSGDFVAMVTSGAYSGNLATDTVTSGIYHKLATLSGSTHTFNFDNNGRFIRIQRAGGSTATLELAEVEVLSPAGALYTRDFYLPYNATGECNYTISAGYDASVNPVAADNCSGITNYSNSLPGNPATVDGLVLNMDETQTITWKAIDDAPDSTSLDVEYTLLDTVKPWFIPADRHDGAFDTLTFCDVFPVLRYPVPNGQDNYYCPGNGDYKFTSLDLYIDNRLRYPNIAYDPFALDDTLDVDQAYLSNGPHTLVWRLTDYMNNSVADTMHLFIGERPLITGVRTAGITCGGTNDGIIYIYGTSTNATASVLYYVTNGTDTIASGSPVFSSLEPGNYTAWIVADGCKSTDYGIVLNIADREPIAPYADILPVECFGDSGSIDITQYGTRNLLHLYGGTPGVITAPNYAALDLTATGTIEAFVFFDSISATVNNDAWIIGGNGYGIWLDNGTLTLFVNNTPVATAPGAIAQRTWYHVAGTWGPTSSTLYINSSAYSGSATPNAVSGGSLYIGCSGGGNTLAGIVRFARVWNSELTISQIQDNYRFEDPINYNNSLVANYPLNSDGGASLANKMGAAASFAGGSFAWQPFAYYWLGTSISYFSATEDIVKVPAQDYHLFLSTPFGCDDDTIITLQMTDNNPPILNFYDTLGVLSTIDVDRTILRVTGHTSAWEPATPVNVAGDCWFAPFGGEFDPVIDDGACDASDVTVTWSYSSTNLPVEGSSVNGLQLNDTTVVYWAAVDGAGIPAYKTMTYIIRDNEKPVLPADATISVNAAPGFCYYLVPDSTTLVPTPVGDNCLGDGGYLRNNYNFDQNLYHRQIPVGTHDIRWVYRDKWGNADTMFQHLTVVDNQKPIVHCSDTAVYINSFGYGLIDSSFVNNATTDNCGIATIKLNVGDTLRCADVQTTLSGGFLPVTVTFTDIHNNDSTCVSRVRVIDNINPKAVAKNLTAPIDAAGLAVITPAMLDGGSYDNCMPLDSIWVDPDTLTCANIGDNNVWLFVQDNSGNRDSVLASVSVQDLLPPTIVLKNPIEFSLGSDGYHVVNPAVDIDGGSYDNCSSQLTYTASIDTVRCDDIASVVFTYSVADGYGNKKDSLNVVATVRDGAAPTVVLKDYTLVIPSTGVGILRFDSIIPPANIVDNCESDIYLREISYDGGAHWCTRGDEGTDGSSAYSNKATTATASATYNNAGVGQLKDEDMGTYYSAQGSARPNPTTTVTFVYDLGALYELNNSDIYWYGLNANESNISFWSKSGAQSLAPKSASLSYSSDNVTYTSAGNFGLAVSQYNNINLTGVPARYLRVQVSAPDWYYYSGWFESGWYQRFFGIYEWRVFGRLPGAGGSCISFSCNDVGSTIPVTLHWADAAGNGNTATVNVDVATYFDITEIQLEDCGVSGERFSRTIVGNPTTPTYNWSTLDDGYNNEHLFANGASISPQNCGTASHTSIESSPYLRLCSSWNKTTDYYTVQLVVSDVNSCRDTLDYRFYWDNALSSGGGGASSVKEVTICKGQEVTMTAELPAAGNWEWLKYKWVYPGSDTATYVSGGGVSQNTLTLRFDQDVDSALVSYNQTGMQYDLVYGDNYVYSGDSLYCQSCYAYGAWKTNIMVYGDRWAQSCNPCRSYWFPCDEGVVYDYEILDVTTPLLTAMPLSTVCPFDTVTYTVSNTLAFDHYGWDVFNNLTDSIPTGRILSGGNFYNNFIQVIWNDTSKTPTIHVTGYNALDCSKDTTYYTDYYDITPPTIVCPTDTTHATAALRCDFTFQNALLPAMSDNCVSGIGSYTNNSPYRNSLTNAGGTYPVGTTPVTWTVKDYMGNTSTCMFNITVFDGERPRIETFLNDTTLYTTTLCSQVLDNTRRDATATDNCTAAASIVLTAQIEHPVGTVVASGLTTLQNHIFDLGTSIVTWTATDGVGLPATKSFPVYVVDKTPPLFAEPTFSALPVIPATTDAGKDFATISVNYPNKADPTVCSDNCLAIDSIYFIQRDDFLALSAPYPLDTTVITWRAVDLNGNGTSRTQLVVVTDNEKPHLEVQPNDTITACDISGHFLRIPATSDNSNLLDTLFYSVVGPSYNFRDTLINNFDPNGDGTTDPIPDLTAESNYTVTWRVVDHSGMDSVMFYTLHVEVRPEIIMPNGIMTSNLACGGTNTGSIIIDSYNSEPGQNVEFTIDAWSAYIQSTATNGASANTFSLLPGRDDYGVQIRVNDCYSTPITTVKITEPDAYFLSGTIVKPYCAEDDSGSIAPIVEGGVDGQFLLSGGSISVPDYNELDLIASGTMEAWVYMRDGFANAGATLISKGGAYAVSIDASGFLAMSAGGTGFSTAYTPKQDSWFHVAATWSGGSGSIYVDGALVGSGSVGTPTANGSTLDVGGGFNGVIREVRIWSSDWSTIGDQKNTKYEGNETFPGGYRIVCYLPLENISGGTTLNRSNTSANGSVSGAAWAPTPAYPQPGTYEWTSNVGYSNSNDSISISNLKAGEYTLTFYDIYGCPGGVGLTHLFILQAEDHTPPAISSPLNVPVLEADDDCGHIITNAEELTLLPVINSNNDGHNCDYTFSWQVYSQATGKTTPKTTSLVGANLGIGTNTIYVEVEQNGYTNTFNYNVTVADSLEPTPRATLPTGIQLNSTVGGGSVTVAAEVFNNKVTTSDDNCTPDNLLRYKVSRNSQPFTDSITFTCADITTPVDVTLRVYDLNNNFADVTQNGVTVRDTVDPVFLKDALLIDGNCAVAEDAGGVGNLTHVPNLELIPGTHYGDNCSVSQIYYRIVNTDYPTYSDAGYTPLNAWVDLYNSVFHEGTSEVWFYLVDASGNTSISKVMFNVEVLDMPNPTGFGGN